MTIEVQNLSKRYGDRYAVRDVSFTVQPGAVTGFLGPNGAGKSTTMRSIVGLDRPSSGQALIDGKQYASYRAPLQQVGALLDARSAHKSRTAVNYLASIAATHHIPRARVDEVLDATGLTSVAKKKVGGFSLGMGQRLGIAAALLGDPSTLILDEPVNGLDPEGVTWVRTLLGDLAAEGRTVFLSSHLLSELALIADHVIIIGRGEIIADSPIDALTAGGQTRVRVRTTETAALSNRIANAGVTVTSSELELLEIDGLTAEEIARAAREAGILLTELTPVRQTLEDAYNALTRDAVEYASTGL
ncbi:ATP-binding cassette domain-containing protein [Microbacterium sp. ISL-59]|uniref:ABC transporter ATP-binding protein n=1 Tax=Microbacterium sp. ISL-59 TaxID=2819159 RepID=UPI001BEA93DC|nr:ATP-binding cassette domain-containing protein [Microbacterium sp. ISL-59]MBT2496711.1 ATP-binding cassette domain-containing protein [Microbacterium sp. ISL-59]